MSNPCVECGKQRVNGKTWKEKVGVTTIIHTLTICPDPDCQKIVEKAIAERKAKSDFITSEKLKAKLARSKQALTN